MSTQQAGLVRSMQPAFMGRWATLSCLQGTLVTMAIGLHNIPEGLAVATVLVARGVSPRQAALWAVATSLPQPLLAVPAFLFVDTFRALLPIGLGFACGCMVWIVFAELLPDALETAPAGKVNFSNPPPPPPSPNPSPSLG